MPVENTNYRGKQLLVGRMSDLTGNTLSKAIDISAFASEITITDKPQKKEVAVANNNGQQSSDITGSTKYEGTVNIHNARGLSALLMGSIIGKSTPHTFNPLTAPAWGATTVTEKGNKVTLTGGKYLVAQNSGTTGVTEPVLTTEVDYDNLPALDGDVQWKLRDNLYAPSSYETGFCTDTLVLIERAGEGCGSSAVFDRIVEGVEFTYCSISKSDGAISSEQSIPFMATSERRSSQADFEDITVTTSIKPREDYWLSDDCVIRVDGAKYGTLLNFELTYTRNVTMTDSTEPYEQITSVNSPTFTGNGTLKLDPEEYEALLKTEKKSISIVMDSFDGEKVTYTIPTTTFDEPDINREGSREFWMNFVMKPTGNSTQAMATVDVETATNWA